MENNVVNNNVLVYHPGLAKHLLKRGHTIVDIAPNRWDTKRTVFYFAMDDTLYQDIAELAPHHSSEPTSEEEESHAD